MIIGIVLLLILLSAVKPEIGLTALAICVVVAGVLALLATSFSIEWREVVSLVPVVVAK
jgi:hypothetical protein